MKTIAQQLNIKTFPFEIKIDGNKIYYENSGGGWWVKWEYQDGNIVYYETSNGFWYKRKWQDGKLVYH